MDSNVTHLYTVNHRSSTMQWRNPIVWNKEHHKWYNIARDLWSFPRCLKQANKHISYYHYYDHCYTTWATAFSCFDCQCIHFYGTCRELKAQTGKFMAVEYRVSLLNITGTICFSWMKSPCLLDTRTGGRCRHCTGWGVFSGTGWRGGRQRAPIRCVTEQCMFCNPARALLRVPAATTIPAQLAWLQYHLCRHAHFNTVSLNGWSLCLWLLAHTTTCSSPAV